MKLAEMQNKTLAQLEQHADKLAKETELTADQIRQLPNLSFYEVAGDLPPRRRRLPFIGRRYVMNPKDWARVEREQARRFYRKPEVLKTSDFDGPDNWAPYFL